MTRYEKALTLWQQKNITTDAFFLTGYIVMMLKFSGTFTQLPSARVISILCQTFLQIFQKPFIKRTFLLKGIQEKFMGIPPVADFECKYISNSGDTQSTWILLNSNNS